jgi:RND family efflux transporter MFP subunit
MRALPHIVLLGAAILSSVQVQAVPQVPVLTLGARAVSTGSELDGVVEAVRQATVAAQATGRVASLLVKVGDKVRAGQVLATIDDRDTQTGVARSQAQVTQAEAELANAQAHVQRTRELRKQGFVSQAALDAAETQYKAAQAARAGAGAGAQQARLAQSFTQVTAPFDGYVMETLTQAGDLAVPGKPVAVVYAPQPLRVVVQVPASLGAQARSAQRIELQMGNQWVQPAAQQGVAAADPVSQTLTWKMDVPAALSDQLMPGQQTRVRFVGGTAQRMVVPQAAVLRRGELTAVYMAADKGFVLKAVRLGPTHAEQVEVLAGLKAGDAVAVNAIQAGLAGAQPAK